MKQNQLILARPGRFLAASLLLASACLSGVSCLKDDPNGPRDEYLEVYASADSEEEAATTFCVGVRGGDHKFYLKTNVPLEELQIEWQDEDSSPWASVKTVEEVSSGLYSVTLSVNPRSSYAYYTRRSGMLLISAPERNLGSFITIFQGSTARFSNNCANFTYGVVNPYFTDGERIYSGWSAAQKGYFLTENSFDGVSYVYGRNGHLMLGDSKGHGGCIVTPYVDAMRSDSLLMVSFRAVAYADGRVSDNNRIKVDILGGGIFRDDPEQESRSMELEVPHLDSSDPDFPANMWNDAEFMLFIQSSARYPISANTQIRITSGSLEEQSKTNSRVYVSNVYIRRLVEGTDEDYFSENGGSGVDRILGLSSTKEEENPIE